MRSDVSSARPHFEPIERQLSELAQHLAAPRSISPGAAVLKPAAQADRRVDATPSRLEEVLEQSGKRSRPPRPENKTAPPSASMPCIATSWR